MLSDEVPEFAIERPRSTAVLEGELMVVLEGESASPVSADAGRGTQWTVWVFHREAELVSLKS